MNSVDFSRILFYAYSNRLNKEVRICFTHNGVDITGISNKSRGCVTQCTYNAEPPQSLIGRTVYIADVKDLLDRIKVSNVINNLEIVNDGGMEFLRYSSDVFLQSIPLVNPLDMYPKTVNIPEEIGTIELNSSLVADILLKMKTLKNVNYVKFTITPLAIEIKFSGGGNLIGVYTAQQITECSIETEDFAYDDILKILSVSKKHEYLCIKVYDVSFMSMSLPITDNIGTVSYYLIT